MVDINEVGCNLRYLCQVNEQLHHCAVATNLHIYRLCLLPALVGMYPHRHCHYPLQIHGVYYHILKGR